MRHISLIGNLFLVSLAFSLSISSYVLKQKVQPAEEKEYPEALFTLGEISTVELEMPEATWQTLIKNASDKEPAGVGRNKTIDTTNMCSYLQI